PSIPKSIEEQHAGECHGQALRRLNFGLRLFFDTMLGSGEALVKWGNEWGSGGGNRLAGGERRGFRRNRALFGARGGEILAQSPHLGYQPPVLVLQPIQPFENLLKLR